ncbi:hypothetical protein [Saccharopolyspora rosea]|uniref:Uncharacterized protein n=1 Tax=Saccharopolyspora rosea TaxID=524884 RepID=A0ABW3FSS5_9PSEU|nr:hypothetical protein [Saccharopolyspora rosea]
MSRITVSWALAVGALIAAVVVVLVGGVGVQPGGVEVRGDPFVAYTEGPRADR